MDDPGNICNLPGKYMYVHSNLEFTEDIKNINMEPFMILS